MTFWDFANQNPGIFFVLFGMFFILCMLIDSMWGNYLQYKHYKDESKKV